MSANYKDTLNLPQTGFPMKAGLVAREPEMLEKWEREGLYERIQEARADAPLFVLHDGPPFANGDVHMGTALNKILKDIIVKSRTMLGFRAPFIPGWDCHGLPIEFKVVKESRGLAPAEVRRRSEEYARKYIDIQRRQFKRLGVFGDWENPYLTLAPGYEAEIIRAFAGFVEKGLVYQSQKPVLWSTGAQTALAEAEVEYEERNDPAIYVKIPLTSESAQRLGCDGRAFVVVWTTTPWTLPANVAVAASKHINYWILHRNHEFLITGIPQSIPGFDDWQQRQDAHSHPRSIEGSHLESLEYDHPFLDRVGTIYLADFVTSETGTGLVHIAPGHGKDDYILGHKHGLPVLSPVDEYGKFTEEVGIPEWVGKYVFDANAEIVAFLRENGSLLAEQKYTHEYPHCWRSKTPIVFRAVEQFFIRIDDLRADVLDAIDKVQWLPPWGQARIRGAVETRPDWCISRQRSWGVPLPIFYKNDEPVLNADWARKVADLVEKAGTNVWFELDDATIARELGLPDGLTRRNDTLDVWIDSGVSHEAVLRQRPELRFPADVYIEATDQHRGWFNSSITTAVALRGESPYKTCITHGFVVDEDRRKISKSASYQKPMDAEHFVGKHGADIVRLWVSSVLFTDDVPFSEEMFTRLADTYRRIRNTLRILLGNLADADPSDPGEPTLIDRWAQARLQEVIASCREAYERYEFHRVYHTLNQFCAVDLSSLYIDITKDRLYCDAPASPRRRATQAVMREIFDALTRLLAPILVFTADEAWSHFGENESVHLEEFPTATAADSSAIQQVEQLLALRTVISQSIEQARQEKLIGNALEAAVTLEIPNKADLGSSLGDQAELEEVFILSKLTIIEGTETCATVTRIDDPKCARCWRHRPSVGTHPAHPELCDRCAAVVG